MTTADWTLTETRNILAFPIEEDIPMTMQIAIPAKNNQFVLVSDTKALTRVGAQQPDVATYESKIIIAERHQVAIAISGNLLPNKPPAQEFADHISGLSSLPDDFRSVVEKWAIWYEEEYSDHCLPWQFRLFIVHPRAKYEPLFVVDLSNKKLREESAPKNGGKHVDCHSGCHIPINGTNPASMWPRYYKCGEPPYGDITAATNIAVLTLLMGAAFSDGIGGIDIWKYTDCWRRSERAEEHIISERFAKLKTELDSFVHG
jgi:hypothetical protein